jgi:hypothetical protein
MMPEDLSVYLPKHLSPASKDELLAGLQDFPSSPPERYYTSALNGEEISYQGDCLLYLLFVDLPDSTTAVEGLGLVVSNTCDTDPSNKRDLLPRLIYCPVISLQKFALLLQQSGVTQKRVEAVLESVRSQRITNLLFLPAFGGLTDDSAALLDKVTNCRSTSVTEVSRRRVQSLSNFGHYLLLYKLSIHLTRFNDNVDRALPPKPSGVGFHLK